MARVLLIQPPLMPEELFARGSKTSASVIPPLGLAYIAAYLHQHGHECVIVDGIAEFVTIAELTELAGQFDVVGVTIVSTYALRAVELIRKLKEASPHVPIVVGGPHVTALPEPLLHYGADYAVVGEGEVTMQELVEYVASGVNTPPGHIRGIGLLENGIYFYTGNRKPIEPLDQIPFPARDLLPMQSYQSSIARTSRQPSLSMLTSRGCPGVCSFCSKKTFGTRVRYFSVDRIVEEFFLLRDHYGARDVAVWDDNFLSNHEVVHAVCEELCRRNFGLTWSVEARIDCVDRSVLQALQKAGCEYIAYGIESGSQRMLDHVNKKISKDKIRETVKMTKEIGLKMRGYFMMGLPGETPEDIEATIRFAIELDVELASFTLFVPLPATLEYKRATASGIFDPEYYLKRIIPEFNFLDEPVYVPEGFTVQSLMALHKQAYNRYYLRPKMVWRKLASIRSVQDLNILVRGGYTLIANFLQKH
jgi:anaerobic magnesium-protoporphyrin IX monomethyl ester cyclase